MPHNKVRHIQWGVPLIVKMEFDSGGKTWTRGETFDWKRKGIDPKKIERLFYQGYLHHGIGTKTPKMMQPLNDVEMVETMEELRKIAEDEGAPFARSKEDQRQAILEHRKAKTEG